MEFRGNMETWIGEACCSMAAAFCSPFLSEGAREAAVIQLRMRADFQRCQNGSGSKPAPAPKACLEPPAQGSTLGAARRQKKLRGGRFLALKQGFSCARFQARFLALTGRA